MLSLTTAAISFSSLSAPLRPAVSFGRIGTVVAQNEMEPGEGWNVDNLTGMMDDAVQASGDAQVAAVAAVPTFDVKTMPGITAPLGFFDPLNFCGEASEGKIRFYREVEIKHGRVGMLAALGFLVGEQFHPLWGGNIDVPSYIAFQETPLQPFWPVVVFAIACLEVFSVFTFASPFKGEVWAMRSDHTPGEPSIGRCFDPLGLKPTDPAELLAMQNKELNNGRLAMLAAAGMIFQETFVTHDKLF